GLRRRGGSGEGPDSPGEGGGGVRGGSEEAWRLWRARAMEKGARGWSKGARWRETEKAVTECREGTGAAGWRMGEGGGGSELGPRGLDGAGKEEAGSEGPDGAGDEEAGSVGGSWGRHSAHKGEWGGPRWRDNEGVSGGAKESEWSRGLVGGGIASGAKRGKGRAATRAQSSGRQRIVNKQSARRQRGQCADDAQTADRCGQTAAQ
ncbi:hypothetical protein BJY52DRAFT_1225147, partial [Lactarius psammicola]